MAVLNVTAAEAKFTVGPILWVGENETGVRDFERQKHHWFPGASGSTASWLINNTGPHADHKKWTSIQTVSIPRRI